MIAVHRQPDLFQIIGALRPPRRLACRLDRGQQQRNQDRDDRDHDQEFDEREPRTTNDHVQVSERGRDYLSASRGGIELRT